MMRQNELETALDWHEYDRFLLIGNEQGAYDIPAPDLAGVSTPALDRCLVHDGVRAVRSAANLLVSGRACRPEPALWVLARAIAEPSPRVRREALDLLPYAVRTGAQLSALVAMLKRLTPMDRPVRAALGTWYSQRTVIELVNMVLRSPQDAAYSHREILGLADSKPPTKAHAVFFNWIKTGVLAGDVLADPGLEMLSAYHLAQTTQSEAVILALLHRWPALREHLPAPWLKRPPVWRQILPCLSSEALVRWLPKMAEADLLCAGDPVAEMVVQRLQLGALSKGVQAPFAALAALGAIRQSCLRRNTVIAHEIEDALLALFHHRVRATAPTTGTVVIAIDPAASTAPDGAPDLPGIAPRTALAAFALMVAASAKHAHLIAFGRDLTPIALAPGETIDSLLAKLDAVPHGPGDGAGPMDWAHAQGVTADAFVILNGTRPKKLAKQPEQALSQYRERTGKRAKWLAVSAGAHRLCAAPPLDLDMVEAHGFDASVPALFLELLAGG